jgi:gamma-glutamyltranspeptidase
MFPPCCRPGKKPLSSMSPLIVEQEGALRMVVGASGGPRIISAVLQTVLRVIAYGNQAFEAVAGARLHHQLVPDFLYSERWSSGNVSFSYDQVLLEELEERGNSLQHTRWGAVTQAVVLETDAEEGAQPWMHGVSDPRKDGAPAGY